jgi:ribosomal protein S16
MREVIKMSKIPLEQKIVQEINSIEISIGPSEDRQIRDIDLVKPLLYGIGIDVTKNLIEQMESKTKYFKKDYLEYNYENAIIEFQKDFLLHNFAKAGFDKKQAGINMGLGKDHSESPRIVLNQIARRLGFDSTILEDYLGDYEPQIQIQLSQEELIKISKDRIKRYCGYGKEIGKGIIKISSICDFLEKKSEMLSKKFIDLAKEYAKIPLVESPSVQRYDGLTFKDALKQFKIDYLRAQFYLCDMDGNKMARKLGKKQSAIRVLLSDYGIPMTQLRYEAKLGVAREVRVE